MPPYLFNLIPEHLTPYESVLELYSVFRDDSELGQKWSSTLKHGITHTLPKHSKTTKQRNDLPKTKT